MTNYEDDGNGVLYTSGYQQLYSASLASHVEINSNCREIRGESPFSYAFKDSATTLRSFSFQPNSQLETIQPYAFYQCVNLESIDLSSCSKLKYICEYSFSYCTSVKTINLPNSLEELGNFSLSYTQSLSTISLPPSLKFFGNSSLYRSGITSIQFDTDIKIKSIPWRSLSDTKITELEIPASVESFVPSSLEATYLRNITVAEGNQVYKLKDGFVVDKNEKTVYYYPTNSSEAKVPDGITTIINSALTYCLINTLYLPSGLIEILNYAFSININLQTLKIPNTVTTIQNNAFYGCYSLYEVEFEPTSTLTSLEGYLFYGCSNLTSIHIPQSVQYIGTVCFFQCTKLQNVTIESSSISIQDGAFTGCSDSIEIIFINEINNYFITENKLMIRKNENKYTILSILNNPETVEIPDDIINIGQYAFAYKTNIMHITFIGSNKFTTIGNYAFSQCTKLQNIELPSSVISIGYCAFEYCDSLKTINIPNVAAIEGYTFQYCIHLTSVIFNQLTIIKANAFLSCESLNNIDFGSSKLNCISQYSFANTISLQSLTFPQTLATIESMSFYNSSINSIIFADESQLNVLQDSAFYYATNLSTITNLPSSIQSIGSECFAYTSLTTFTIPQGTKTIGDRCFMNSPHLTIITIPEGSSLETLGNEIGRNCPNLTKIELPLNNPNFAIENEALFNKNLSRLYVFPPASLTKVFSLPQKVEVISMGAFYGCKNLVHVLIPENGSLSTIGQNAFAECTGLQIINLPRTITSINSNAFHGCHRISCGQIVDIDKSLIDALISSGFPRKALSQQCNNTCKNSLSLATHYLLFAVMLPFISS